VPGFSLADIRNTDSRELEWFYSRLIQQLQEENETYSDIKKKIPHRND